MRWVNCPSHRGDDVQHFLNERFTDPARRVLLLGGAGFDPRASVLPLQLQTVLGDRLRTVLLKEERPESTSDLVSRADRNQDTLTNTLSDVTVVPIDVLSADMSVIGGRAAVHHITQEFSRDVSDAVVDVSALSSGISFPIIRFALEWADQEPSKREMHVVLAGHSIVDHSVHAMPLDKSKEIFGFKGEYGLESTSEAAKLWLPQLAYDQRDALIRIYEDIRPHDVCPILPFPSRDPRAGDRLLEHFTSDVLDTWEVAPKNVIFAAEGNPLDLYRTVLRIDDERTAVFREAGGSQLLLTPTGSKALALGALMAAIERDLPVRYVESIGYRVEWDKVDQVPENDLELLHLWLAGEPYSSANGAGTG